jgi:hypothetical protein
MFFSSRALSVSIGAEVLPLFLSVSYSTLMFFSARRFTAHSSVVPLRLKKLFPAPNNSGIGFYAAPPVCIRTKVETEDARKISRTGLYLVAGSRAGLIFKETMRLNACLAKSTVVAALEGLPFGFDIAVISGTTQRD